MKLSDYKDEKALDLLAELIEPATEILSDTEIRNAATGSTKAAAVSIAIKKHKSAVMTILAALDGVPVEEYHCSVLTLPLKLLEILNDKETMQLFRYAGQTAEQTASGSRTENTEATEQ
jgi:hypothetical protein